MKKVTLGLAGGYGGKDFQDYTLPMDAKVTEVHIFASKFIDAIQVAYIDTKGEMLYLPRIGGLGGEHNVFVLDEDEIITGISGHCGWYIDSFRIHTNKRTSDTFGGEGGTDEYQYIIPKNNEFIGFYGRADWHLDAIGLISRENSSKPKPKKRIPKSRKSDLELVEGIGPKIASIFIENGIRDLKDLSYVSVAKLKEILGRAGARYRLADPTTWPEQAALGAKGDWEAMEKLKQKLTGGRRK